MERTLPALRPLPRLTLRRMLVVAGLAGLAFVNAVYVVQSLQAIGGGNFIFDWWVFEESVRRIGTGTMYEWGAPAPMWGDVYQHRYAPLFAYAMVPFVSLGINAWRVLQLASVLLLPRRLWLPVLLTAPLWWDVTNANTMTFALVAAWWAVAGSRVGTVAFFALALLVPRPLMLPVLAWVLWKRPAWRLPFAGMLAVYLALTLATGEAWSFARALLDSAGGIGGPNWAPSVVLGLAWVPIGLALAAWLTWCGHLGWASVAIMPYLMGYHLAMLFLELRRTDAPPPRGRCSPSAWREWRRCATRRAPSRLPTR